MREAFDDAARGWGGLDVVVANAGQSSRTRTRPWTGLSTRPAAICLSVNLTVQFLTCKHGARHLLAAGGAIVCLGSNCGSLARPR